MDNNNGPKFLVVDDDKALLDVVEALLSSMGCEVVPIMDSTRALNLIGEPEKANEFDAIFLDVMMPGVNGMEILAKLKENEATRNIPVIMLTAVDSYTSIMDGYKIGADYYITKPVTKDQMVYALDMVLAREDQPFVKKYSLPEA